MKTIIATIIGLLAFKLLFRPINSWAARWLQRQDKEAAEKNVEREDFQW